MDKDLKYCKTRKCKNCPNAGFTEGNPIGECKLKYNLGYGRQNYALTRSDTCHFGDERSFDEAMNRVNSSEEMPVLADQLAEKIKSNFLRT